MEKIKYYIEKYKIIIILILLGIALTTSLLYAILRPNKKEEIKLPSIIKEEKQEEVIEDNKIKVDIKGYVEEPGVYEMENDSRVIDVVNKAGGLKEEANTGYINLSKKIFDEMIIIIYSNNDIERLKENKKEIIYIEQECICPDNINDACIKKDDVLNIEFEKAEEKNDNYDKNSEEKKDTLSESDDKKDELISINNATLEELMTLNGIGESKAKAIIEYREENGKFKKLEDIMNVSGIGESAYSKIKDSIKL